MHPPTRPLAVVAVAASAAVSLLLSGPARAAETTTTTTSSSSSTSTSTTVAHGAPSSSTSSTTSTSTSTTTTTSTTSTTSTTLVPEPVPEDAVPPEIQAMIDAYPRTPAGSTAELVEVLDDVPHHAWRGAFGRFPVAGLASWSHDWLFPRHVPDFHVHQGTDVFARRGTPVVSPAAGRVEVSHGSIGGLAVEVVQPDGTSWYLAHLERATVEDGASVVPGDLVGTVGDSGNAKGSSPHVHVEVRPHGGRPADPKPLLDAAYEEALAAAPAFVAARDWSRPPRLAPLPEDAAPRPVIETLRISFVRLAGLM